MELDKYASPSMWPDLHRLLHHHHLGNSKEPVDRNSAVSLMSVARNGGLVKINGVPLSKYFPCPLDRHDVIAPLVACGVCGEYDIKARVKGGGPTGQSQAIRLAIARALINQNPLFHPVLRKAGYVSRDRRVVERKKPGRKKVTILCLGAYLMVICLLCSNYL
jgi:ribosomal protein S9